MKPFLLVYLLEPHQHLWRLVLIVEVFIILAANLFQQTYLLLLFICASYQYVFNLYILLPIHYCCIRIYQLAQHALVPWKNINMDAKLHNEILQGHFPNIPDIIGTGIVTYFILILL